MSVGLLKVCRPGRRNGLGRNVLLDLFPPPVVSSSFPLLSSRRTRLCIVMLSGSSRNRSSNGVIEGARHTKSEVRRAFGFFAPSLREHLTNPDVIVLTFVECVEGEIFCGLSSGL